MKTSPIVLALVVIAGCATWYFFTQTSAIPIQETISPEAGNEKAQTPTSTRNTATLKMPKIATRSTASEVLSAWWVKFSPEDAARYSVELIEKSATLEDYQVYYMGRPIQHLTIRQDLSRKQEIIPLEPFIVIDDRDLLNQDVVADKVRTKNSDITDVRLEDTVWGLGDNRSLYLAYRFRVTINGSDTKQVWTANAKTGEITSINTYSRH